MGSIQNYVAALQRALIVKVLGKTSNFRVLEACIKKLWDLDMGCELIDLDKASRLGDFTPALTILKS